MVDRSGGDEACWPFGSGPYYGRFSVDGKYVAAHRFSYELFYGHIPDALEVMHHCDYPPCVNPRHLSVASHRRNMLDALGKGRLPTARQMMLKREIRDFCRERLKEEGRDEWEQYSLFDLRRWLRR